MIEALNIIMKNAFQIVIICFLLFSCKDTTKEVNEKPIKKEVLTKQIENIAPDNEVVVNSSNKDVKIKFSDLTILIKDIEMASNAEYSSKDTIYETKKDTAYFNLMPGTEWMINKIFKIEQAEFNKIELYGQFEIKIELEIDGKGDSDDSSCILSDWKGYTSEWRELKVNQEDLKFLDLDKDKEDPISFTIDELKLAVKEHCGDEWFDGIKNIQSLDKIHTSFFTTKYIYKIKAKNSKTNQIIEKYIVFYTPTSC
jgi:hypothetical protein